MTQRVNADQRKFDRQYAKSWFAVLAYCNIEKLHNLEALPSTGFMITCFPVKIERASVGWTRAVAIIEE
jgi:kynurenine formamidase